MGMSFYRMRLNENRQITTCCEKRIVTLMYTDPRSYTDESFGRNVDQVTRRIPETMN